MSYPRILAKIFNTPLAIDQPVLGTILNALGARHLGSIPSEADDRLPANIAGRAGQGAGRFAIARQGVDRFGELINFSARAHAAGLQANAAGGSYSQAYNAELASAPAGQTMVIFGSGIMGKHLDSMEEMCAGGLSVDKIQAALIEARDDDKVSSVVLHLDSPGGMVYGCTETAALIGELSSIKPIVGFCDSKAASAAYWLLSACDAVYVTASADLGSIGIYSVVFDQSEQFAKQGVKVELFKDGIYKAAGFPGTQLSDQQRAHLQETVLACSAQFKGDVKSYRPGIADDTMQGQCYFGQAAVDRKLADELVPSLECVVRDLSAN